MAAQWRVLFHGPSAQTLTSVKPRGGPCPWAHPRRGFHWALGWRKGPVNVRTPLCSPRRKRSSGSLCLAQFRPDTDAFETSPPRPVGRKTPAPGAVSWRGQTRGSARVVVLPWISGLGLKPSLGTQPCLLSARERFRGSSWSVLSLVWEYPCWARGALSI